MKIGFYAPLKSPDHPVPSGDRAMAKLLVKALIAYGHEVDILSTLRSWEGEGSQKAQSKLRTLAQTEVARLGKQYQNTKPLNLIFTYHVYHKAPDWIGVALASQWRIPYVIAEVSYAPKQNEGHWKIGHKQTLKCIQKAKSIIVLNPVDVECIKPLLKTSQSIEMLKPFLAKNPPQIENTRKLKKQFAIQNNLNPDKIWLITVAMMRPGDKAASYRQLAESLTRIHKTDWQLVVIGDGEASGQVKENFKSLSTNCFFAGKLDHDTISRWFTVCDLFVWPAVNEAYGLALLEALAAGLPAVVQNYGGVSSIVENNKTGLVTDPANQHEFTQALKKLICNENLRKQMGRAAKQKFIAEHSFNSAAAKINTICNSVIL